MTRLTKRLLIGAAAIAFMGTATVSAETLQIGLNEDVDTLDPDQGRTFGGRHVFANLCDKLFDIDADLNIVPELATAYQISEDGTEVVLTLREGAVFHDGTPFNAEAVKANVERSLTIPESARKSDLAAIEEVEVRDDLTAVLHLSEPFSPLLAQLADRAGMMVSPAAAASMSAEEFGANPVCSGPYAFEERVVQDRIVLSKFADHWNADAYAFDEVVYLPIPDATVRLNNLLAGELDIIEQVPTNALDQVRQNEGTEAEGVTGLGHFHIQFNMGNGEAANNPFGQDARLRQALELVLDRNIINEVVFGGAFVPGNQPVAPGTAYYAESMPIPERDVEAAQALIGETDIDNPTLGIVVNNNPTFLQVAEVIQSLAREAGITIELQPANASTANAQTTAGDFEGFFTFWSGRVDPDGNIYTYFGCESTHNVGKYCNPEVEELITQARSATSQAERAELYSQAAEIYLKDLPVLYLYHPVWFFGYDSALEGFEPIPDGLIRITGVTQAG